MKIFAFATIAATLLFSSTHCSATQDTIKIGVVSGGGIVLTVSSQAIIDAIVQTEGGGFNVHTLVVENLNHPYIIAYCTDDVARAYECFEDGGDVYVFALGDSHSCKGNDCGCCYWLRATDNTIVGCKCDTAGTIHPFCDDESPNGTCTHSMTSDGQTGLMGNLSSALGL